MTIDTNQVMFFAGKKITIGEFIELYDMKDESEEAVSLILEKLEKKGKVKFLNIEEKSDEAFDAVAKELALEEKIARIEQDAEDSAVYAATKNKEGKLVYEEIEIDFPTKKQATEMLEYCETKLKLEGEITKPEDVYVVTLFDVSESDLGAIKRRGIVESAGSIIVGATNTVSAGVLDTASFATERIVVPTAKAGIKTVLGLTKTLVKTGAATSSAVISGTSKNARAMKTELAEDEDVLRAKKELVDAKDAIFRLLGKGSKSGGIRIK